VEIGRDLGGFFEIAKGISPGDHAIISPSDLIQDNMVVNPVLAAAEGKATAKAAK